jgi:hypothetical protein
MLNWLVDEKRIAPHIPVFDRSKREDGTLSREDFRYDGSTDTYTCPAGKRLTTTGHINGGDTVFYRSSVLDCAKCQFKPTCCPKTPQRWLRERGIEGHVMHSTSVAVSREHKRAKTDRLDLASVSA